MVTAKEIITLAEEISKEEYYKSVEGDIIDVTHGDGDDCEWEMVNTVVYAAIIATI